MKALASIAAFAAFTLVLTSSALGAPGDGPRGGGPGGPGGPGRGHGFGPGPRAGAGHLARRIGDIPTTRVLEMMTRRLDLTTTQQQQIQPILEETRRAVQAGAEVRRQAMEQTREKILAVLTPEQKEKAEKMRNALFAGIGGFLQAQGPEVRERLEGAGEEMRLRAAIATLDLTEDQKTRLKEVDRNLQEKRREIQESIRPQLDALREDAKKQVNEILTPEQKTRLEQKLQEMPKGPRPDGPRGDRHRRGGEGPHRGHGGPGGPRP